MRPEFSLPEGNMGKKVIIFGIDMSLSVHNDNKKKDVLILGIVPTRGLDDTTLTADIIVLYYISIIMGATILYLLMLKKYIKSKQEILK